MQLGLPFRRPPAPGDGVVTVAGHPVAIRFVRHRRARHYILRVAEDGSLRVTVPRGGSRAEALRLVDERRAWIEQQRYKQMVAVSTRRAWVAGTEVLFAGETLALTVAPVGASRLRVTYGDHSLLAPAEAATNLRGPVEHHMRQVAARQLPARLMELAGRHGLTVTAVSIRNQRSRWGSCSASGRISLNWRLIQFPAAVADYVIVHELAHLKHLNHSRRFWAEVAGMCPDYEASRAWLRQHHRGSA